METAGEVGRLFRLLQFLAGGFVLGVLGGLRTFFPEFRDNPKIIGVGDAVRGATGALGGVALGLLGWWSYRKVRRVQRKQ